MKDSSEPEERVFFEYDGIIHCQNCGHMMKSVLHPEGFLLEEF